MRANLIASSVVCRSYVVLGIILSTIVFGLFARNQLWAMDAIEDAWMQCAIKKAGSFGESNNPEQDSHLILGECAAYEFGFLVSLRQRFRSEVVFKTERIEKVNIILKIKSILKKSQ